jgi:hypothetical protein
MLWFYAQNDREAQIELRYDNGAGEYVMIVNWPHRREEERFATVAAFRKRVRELEEQLAAERWNRQGSVMILPDGWRDKSPTH